MLTWCKTSLVDCFSSILRRLIRSQGNWCPREATRNGSRVQVKVRRWTICLAPIGVVVPLRHDQKSLRPGTRISAVVGGRHRDTETSKSTPVVVHATTLLVFPGAGASTPATSRARRFENRARRNNTQYAHILKRWVSCIRKRRCSRRQHR